MGTPMDPHGPLDRMGRWDDPELAEIFRDDPDLYELSRTVRASRPDPVLGPHFEPYLRARLMDVAAHQLRPRGLSRWLRPRPGILAGGGAALGVAMIAAVVVATVMYRPNDSTTFQVSANVAGNPSVSPDDVIRVSFNQAVDHAAVERNLEIHPATAVQTRWEDTTLVITPVHHLSANTPYTVTIPRSAVRDQSGHAATADIHFTFGTAATPTPGPTSAPVQPPVIDPQQLGPLDTGSRLLIGPDGSVLATGGLLLPPPAMPAPSSAASSTPLVSGLLHGRPGHDQPAPSAAPSPTAAEPATARLVRLNAGASPTVLGPEALVARFSPSGRSLAYLVARGQGTNLLVRRPDGSQAVTLVRGADAASPLAWAGEDSLLYLRDGQVESVDLQGRTRPVGGGLQVAAGQDVALAPGGHVAYLGPLPGAEASPSPSAEATGSASPVATPDPASLGHLVDLATGTIRPLQGIRQLPAFSGDGATVAWVDESGGTPALDVMALGDNTASPSVLPTTAGAGDSLTGLALSGDGTRLAYSLTHPDSNQDNPVLRVVSTATGDAVGLGDGAPALTPSLSQNGDRIAFVRPAADGSLSALVAEIPGATPVSPAADAMPADAASVLDRFLDAQLKGDATTLRTLGAASLAVDGSLTPSGVTRYYIIKAGLDTDGTTAVAHVRLVRDAAKDALVASFADETVRLAQPAAGAAYQVTSASVAGFGAEPNGPQVLHVSTERQLTALVVRISFDSDLDPATVSSAAVSLLGPSGALAAGVHYEVESRTLVIRLLDAPAGTLTLAVTDAVHDIAGQPLSGGYATTLQS